MKSIIFTALLLFLLLFTKFVLAQQFPNSHKYEVKQLPNEGTERRTYLLAVARLKEL